MYGRIVNGIIEYAPDTYEFKEGYKLYNFRNNIPMLRYYGFKSIIDNVPTYNKDTEKLNIVRYDETDDTITINYEIVKMLSKEQLEEKVSLLEEEQEVQNYDIINNMIATTEVFEMLISVLSPQTFTLSCDLQENRKSGSNYMIEIYCALILKEKKTLDEVPAMLKKQVEERLKELMS